MPPRRPPNAVPTSTTKRVGVQGAAHDLGLDEVLQREVGGEHDAEHDRRLGESAVAEGDDHGQPATEERADVGDVATDEVHDHDGEHERQTEQEGGDADDQRHDGGHDGAAPRLNIRTCPTSPSTCSTDEAVRRLLAERNA
jgi:hypothetical protein